VLKAEIIAVPFEPVRGGPAEQSRLEVRNGSLRVGLAASAPGGDLAECFAGMLPGHIEDFALQRCELQFFIRVVDGMVGPVQEWYPPMFGIYDFYPPRPRASILSRIGTRTLTLTSSKKILSAVIALPLLKFFLAWLHYRSYQQKSQAQNYTRRKITQGVK
jgi:hypothetical protein